MGASSHLPGVRPRHCPWLCPWRCSVRGSPLSHALELQQLPLNHHRPPASIICSPLRQQYPHDGHEHVLSIIKPMQLGVHELVDSTHDVCVRASSARSPCQTPSQTQAGAPFHPAHRAHGHFQEVYTRSSKYPPHWSAARLRCSRSSGSCTKSTACWSSSCSPGGRGPRPWRLEVCPVSGTL